MPELINFLKDIFMCKDNDCKKIGLSQYKPAQPVEKKVAKKIVKPASEVKLSDLMRKSY